ncbi:MAG: hypothetical protein M1831_004697 [Alyxoria varia]|nr:MAG: hypothetical protein M1831_004697 [Alyxoria varia]
MYSPCASPKLLLYLVVTFGSLLHVNAVGQQQGQQPQCQESQVIVLGAGTAGISAAAELANNGVDDVVILEYNEDIGGRVRHHEFGKKADGTPYTIELGANWIQGLGTREGPENPIWKMVRRHNVTSQYSNYTSFLTYDETGFNDYYHLYDELQDAYATAEQDAGYLLSEDLLDEDAGSTFAIAGWTPRGDPKKQVMEYFEWDWEYCYTPQQSSSIQTFANYNLSFYQWSEDNNFVTDQRGFNTFIKDEASSFLKPTDPRLHLNTTVTQISHNDPSSNPNPHVTVHTADGKCHKAPHVICTFSVGVLQASQSTPNAAPVTFDPPLPRWKQHAIHTFQMGIYTKIFLQFNITESTPQFWDKEAEYALYADPNTRGYYPIWQSLTAPGFLPDSGIFFATVTGTESKRIESMSDAAVLDEILEVLRRMYFPERPAFPEEYKPVDFMFPRWASDTPWAFGSYSNWPPGVTLQQHQNLRANVGGLWFAGEATSAQYYGYLQGAWIEGRDVGKSVAECVRGGGGGQGGGSGDSNGCQEARYLRIEGHTNQTELTPANGWDVSSFLVAGQGP